ncbi:hypothetical protein TcWFU_002382 [Taenia crassiceps]|uniref:Uncharacterized protein n=1 Tax=Taenia crassiceps TaxID=6207 RepID=A0ABR4QH15_9CEST
MCMKTGGVVAVDVLDDSCHNTQCTLELVQFGGAVDCVSPMHAAGMRNSPIAWWKCFVCPVTHRRCDSLRELGSCLTNQKPANKGSGEELLKPKPEGIAEAIIGGLMHWEGENHHTTMLETQAARTRGGLEEVEDSWMGARMMG